MTAMRWLLALAMGLCACRPVDAGGPTGPGPAPGEQIWAAPAPAPPTLAEPIATPPASRAGWVQAPLDEPIADPLAGAEVVAVGTRAAVVRTGGGLLALHAERGVVGRLRLPLGWFWLGLDDRDALYVATPEGALYRSDDAMAGAAASFAPLAQIDGAAAWDVAGNTVVAARGHEVLVSRDRGAHYLVRAVAPGLTVRRVRARPDGVVVAWGHGPSGPVTHLSTTGGAGWVLTSFQPHEIDRVGGVITNTSDTCPASLARDGSWVRGRPEVDGAEAALLSALSPSRAPHAARAPALSQQHPAEPPAAEAIAGHERDCRPFARPRASPSPAGEAAPASPSGCRGVQCIRGVLARAPSLAAHFGIVAGGKVAAIDRRGGFVTLATPPCAAERVLAMRGAGVLVCREGDGVRLHAVGRDGRFFREQAFDWPPEAFTGIDNGDDGTAVIGCAVAACRGRALVRSPNPLGDAGAWREVAVGGAVAHRALLLGAALVMTSPADADTGKPSFGHLTTGDLLGGDGAGSVAERVAGAEERLHRLSFVIARNDGSTRTLLSEQRIDGDVTALDVIDGGVYLTLSPGDGKAPLWRRVDGGKLAPVDALPPRVAPVPAVAASIAPTGIAADDAHVYWTDPLRGLVLRVDRRGGAAQTLARDQRGALAIAVDASHAYFTVAGHYSVADGAVRRVPKQGGSIEQIAAGQLRPEAIAVDPDAVYWTSRGYAGALDGAVLRWLKTGGAPSPLAVGLAEPSAVALGRDDVFFALSAAGSLMRIAKRGGDDVRVIGDQLAPSAIALEPGGAQIGWTHAGGVRHGPLSDPTRAITTRAASRVNAVAACGDAWLATDALGVLRIRGEERQRLLQDGPAGAIACRDDTAYAVTSRGQHITAIPLAGGPSRVLTR